MAVGSDAKKTFAQNDTAPMPSIAGFVRISAGHKTANFAHVFIIILYNKRQSDILCPLSPLSPLSVSVSVSLSLYV